MLLFTTKSQVDCIFLYKKAVSMYSRQIYTTLKNHLSKKQITVITGMRRVGKTTAIKYLLEQIPHDNKVYIDLERIENRHLFNQQSYVDIERGLTQMGVKLTEKAVIALDEIQLVTNIPSVIKLLYDTYDIKFIVTGSSSYYLKNHFTESLAGRKRLFEMWPLNFKEYLLFKNVYKKQIEEEKLQTFLTSFYLLYKNHYEDYIQWGGFPEVVLAEDEVDKKTYLLDVINAYIELDIKLLSDFSAVDTLYKLILLLTNRTGSKVDFSKLSSILGINRHIIKNYITLLEYTYFIRLVKPFSKGIDKALAKQPKLYFTDTGILNVLQKGLSSGHLFENMIAQQLSFLGQLNYYEKKSGAEIDFILNAQKAFEVKETPLLTDYNKLSRRSFSIGLNDFSLIGRYPTEAQKFNDFIWGGSIF